MKSLSESLLPIFIGTSTGDETAWLNFFSSLLAYISALFSEIIWRFAPVPSGEKDQIQEGRVPTPECAF